MARCRATGGHRTTGAQQRLTQGQLLAGQERQIGLRGVEERLGIAESGRQQRAGIRETGTEARLTALQQEMFRRYKENRDYEQAQSQYRA